MQNTVTKLCTNFLLQDSEMSDNYTLFEDRI